MGPDPKELMYSHGKLIDVDVRGVLKEDLTVGIAYLEARNISDIMLTVEPDIFLELLINKIRNEVISYQSFIFRKVKENKIVLEQKLEIQKLDMVANFEQISALELELRQINDIEINSTLEKNANFNDLNGERITPFFLENGKRFSSRVQYVRNQRSKWEKFPT